MTPSNDTFFDSFVELGVNLGFHQEYCELLALVGIAGAVKDNHTMETEWGKIYPNIFAFFLGESSICMKSPTMNLLPRIIENAIDTDSENMFLPSSGTFEGLIKYMAGTTKKKAVVNEKTTGIILIDEWSKWLGDSNKEYNQSIKNAMCEMFDCKTIDKATVGYDVYIKTPCVSFIAGIQPALYRKHITQIDEELGFTPRFLQAYPTTKLPFRALGNGSKFKDEIDNVSNKFKNIYDFINSSAEVSINLDDKCLKYVNRIREHWSIKAQQNEELAKYYMKYQLYIFKLATLFYIDSSVNRINITSVSSDKILYKAFKKAFPIVNNFLQNAIKIKGTNNTTELSELSNKVVEHIEKHAKKGLNYSNISAELSTITRTELSKAMYDKYNINSNQLNFILAQLHDIGKISSRNVDTKTKRTTVYWKMEEVK